VSTIFFIASFLCFFTALVRRDFDKKWLAEKVEEIERERDAFGVWLRDEARKRNAEEYDEKIKTAILSHGGDWRNKIKVRFETLSFYASCVVLLIIGVGLDDDKHYSWIDVGKVVAVILAVVWISRRFSSVEAKFEKLGRDIEWMKLMLHRLHNTAEDAAYRAHIDAHEEFLELRDRIDGLPPGSRPY
jgi:hypothetical protein